MKHMQRFISMDSQRYLERECYSRIQGDVDVNEHWTVMRQMNEGINGWCHHLFLSSGNKRQRHDSTTFLCEYLDIGILNTDGPVAQEAEVAQIIEMVKGLERGGEIYGPEEYYPKNRKKGAVAQIEIQVAHDAFRDTRMYQRIKGPIERDPKVFEGNIRRPGKSGPACSCTIRRYIDGSTAIPSLFHSASHGSDPTSVMIESAPFDRIEWSGENLWNQEREFGPNRMF
ncbi:hypothetical protein C8R44DRAFT_741327 [Mycena epipterygia]|nr:hypothetical protein C8R44DRAFT_741327 [Mycena epipterygia]